jgi:GNAT superfamily N-acetyltransferase
MVENSLAIRRLETADASVIASAFAAIGWMKPLELYEQYSREQISGKRDVLVASVEQLFAGYVTLNWSPTYPPFAAEGVPEVQDLNVLPQFRRRGVGSALLEAIEKLAARTGERVGLCVGLDESYGAAQRLYVRRGYLPDGRGIAYRDRTVQHGQEVIVDHNLVLCFTKRLKG